MVGATAKCHHIIFTPFANHPHQQSEKSQKSVLLLWHKMQLKNLFLTPLTVCLLTYCKCKSQKGKFSFILHCIPEMFFAFRATLAEQFVSLCVKCGFKKNNSSQWKDKKKKKLFKIYTSNQLNILQKKNKPQHIFLA